MEKKHCLKIVLFEGDQFSDYLFWLLQDPHKWFPLMSENHFNISEYVKLKNFKAKQLLLVTSY